MATVDFGLVELLKKLEKVSDTARLSDIKKRTLRRVGAGALKRVRRLTPVDMGDIRRNWTCEADDKRAVIDNAVHYAARVNYGQRTQNGFVRGHFMLEKALGQTAKTDLKPELEKAMEEILEGFE